MRTHGVAVMMRHCASTVSYTQTLCTYLTGYVCSVLRSVLVRCDDACSDSAARVSARGVRGGENPYRILHAAITTCMRSTVLSYGTVYVYTVLLLH